MKYQGWKKRIGKTALAAMIALSLAGTGLAMPTGGMVVTGTVDVEGILDSSATTYNTNDSVSFSGKQVSVTPKEFAVIQWDKFNLAAGESFTGNTGTATLVNIVKNDESASTINGNIYQYGSNPMYIINPSGIEVGSTGHIGATNLVLSAMNYTSDETYEGLKDGIGTWKNGGVVTFASGAVIRTETALNVYGSSIIVADGVTFTNNLMGSSPEINFMSANTYNEGWIFGNRTMSESTNIIAFDGMLTDAGSVTWNAAKINVGATGVVSAQSIDITAYDGQNKEWNGTQAYDFSTDQIVNISGIVQADDENGTVEITGGKTKISGTVTGKDIEINAARYKSAYDTEYAKDRELTISPGANISSSSGSVSIAGGQVNINGGTVHGGTDVQIAARGNSQIMGFPPDIDYEYADALGNGLIVASGADISAGNGDLSGNVTLAGTKVSVGGTVRGDTVNIDIAKPEVEGPFFPEETVELSNTKDNLVNIQGNSNITGNTQVNITGGKVEVAGNVQGGSVNIAAVKKRNENGTVEKSDDNELVIGDAAQIKSTSGKTVLQAGGYNKELSELQEQISGKVELDGVTIDPDGTGWDITDVSFDSGKDMAKDIFAQDKDANGIRKDFQSLAQSINKADANKAKKDAMVAGVLAAVEEQMKKGNGDKMKNIHMDVLRSYEGSKPDMEASDNALKREIDKHYQPDMAEVPEAEIATEPELIDVTFSEA